AGEARYLVQGHARRYARHGGTEGRHDPAADADARAPEGPGRSDADSRTAAVTAAEDHRAGHGGAATAADPEHEAEDADGARRAAPPPPADTRQRHTGRQAASARRSPATSAPATAPGTGRTAAADAAHDHGRDEPVDRG